MSVFPKKLHVETMKILGIIDKIVKMCYETANKISCIKKSMQFIKEGKRFENST